MAAIDYTDDLAETGAYRGKRLADITFTLAVAPFVVAIVAILAFAVSRDGHTPFFAQTRIGRGGKRFRMWKLRTMVPDADRRLEEYLDSNPEARREWDTYQKLKHDPRITPIGRLLRRASLDELPQFWNVLMGDMSVVGPRPIMPEQQALYPSDVYFRMRPGVTGPWQVADRNNVSFSARAQFDGDYLNAQSFSNDIALILRTIGVVLIPNGR